MGTRCSSSSSRCTGDDDMGSSSRHGRDNNSNRAGRGSSSSSNRDGQRRGGRYRGRYHQDHHRVILFRRRVGGKGGKGRERWQAHTGTRHVSTLARLRMCWGLSVQVTCGGSWFHCRGRGGLESWASLCATHQSHRIRISLQHLASSVRGCHHSVLPLTRLSPAKRFSTSMGCLRRASGSCFRWVSLMTRGISSRMGGC